MRRTLAAAAATLAALTLLSACGDDEEPSGSGGSGSPKVIEVSFDGDSVDPAGERVEVGVGQDVELQITADEPGEIHVHSNPEQELAYDSGEDTVTIKGIDRPGVVEVESHELDQVIVQLEVR